eukprot:CAMPEP_0172669498 /NCGR_PEP_ID=MMETSP1074-20121228/9709_1 /TAXON_ID=2916 /ORGANISM="Ceratium fusus, Strain PA161109" /LENGTH=586 /DNA_ID=CAMNT_0013486279 /DNA_START=81 /DNA_END=1841 /DNA_ORIENTATION=+
MAAVALRNCLFATAVVQVLCDRPDNVGPLGNSKGTRGNGAQRRQPELLPGKRQMGQSVLHVTRLHRYDHAGLAAMLQAETLWQASLNGNSTALRTFKQRHNYVHLSEQQSKGLREHHQEVLAGGGMDRGRAEVNDSFLRTGHRKTRARPVTSLKRLDSQYVGYIGVGTAPAEGGNCVTTDPSSFMDAPRLVDDEDSSSAIEHGNCQVTEQSQVMVVFDTGSTNIWIDSDLCTEGPCAKPDRHRYNHKKSLTYKVPVHGLDLHIQFGTGEVTGPQAIDDFHVGPLTVKQQTFGMIQTEQGSVFEDIPLEGILGLAFKKMSANGVMPFFDNIINQKVLDDNQFSFYFNLHNPAANAILWGGADRNFFTGPLHYFKVTDPFYWSIDLVSFRIGDKEWDFDKGKWKKNMNTEFAPAATGSLMEQQQTPKAIVDTGTTFFTAADGLFEKIMDELPSGCCEQVNRTTHPNMIYTLHSTDGNLVDFELTNNEYMSVSKGEDCKDQEYCSTDFMKINIPAEHSPAMVLGEVFLRHFYSVFDRGTGESESTGRVGFARAVHDGAALERLQALTQNAASYTKIYGSKNPEAGSVQP